MRLTLTVSKQTFSLHQLAFDTMAAFNFPDPTVQQTVTNPITGSTYQWKEPPGKWVVTTKVRAVTDIIYEGDRPPAPRGDYKLWYSTDTLELYFWYEDVNGVGAWVPTSAPITMLEDLDEGLFEVRQLLNQVNAAAITNENEIILIRESLGKVNLQEVLDNGNTADKDIYLTHIASSDSDIIDVSPEKAKVIIATEGSKVPTFELQHYAVDDNSQVKLELDEDGTRFDVECDEKVDNIHFRFEDDVKFELNKEGDAVFTGKVQVQPGTEGNEAVTYNQLIEIEEELESIVPSIERGQFDLLLRDIQSGDEGYFNMLRPFSEADRRAREKVCDDEKDACIRNPNIDQIDCESDHDRCIRRIPDIGTGYYPTDEFANVIRLKFSLVDVDGVQHNWQNLKPGMLVDVFNIEDDSYMLAEITGTTGMWYEGVDIDVKVLQFKGKATGRCRIKIFELDLSAGSDVDFVRKQGTNEVTNNWKITSGGKTFFHVQDGESKVYYLQDPAHDQHPVTRGYANSNYFQLNKRNQTTDQIWIRPKNADGEIKGGAGIGNMLVVNQESGEQGSIVRIQQGGEDCLKVEVNKRVNMFHNIVKDLGDPRTNDDGKKDAANRDYVDNKVASINSLNDVAFGRKFKYGFNSTDPRDGDGYCYFGSNYLYLSIEDLDKLDYHINGDTYSDREVTGSGQKHPIMICQQNADGVWELIGSGSWPGETDSRSGYIYVKGVTWTRSNFVKGAEYRIKLSPFW